MNTRQALRNSLWSLAICLSLLPAAALAKTSIEKKIFQFGGPETRGKCVKELKTKGVPQCKTKGLKIKCTQRWVKTCTGAKVEFKQHEFFIVVTGPKVDKAAESALEEAAEAALAVGTAAVAATPGEFAIKVAAGYKAFSTTFVARLSAEPLLASVKDKFKFAIKERGHWPK